MSKGGRQVVCAASHNNLAACRVLLTRPPSRTHLLSIVQPVVEVPHPHDMVEPSHKVCPGSSD